MNPPYRIVHIITTLSSGGAEAMLYKLLKHSPNKHIFNYSVISLTGSGIYEPLLKGMGIPVHCFQFKEKKSGFKNIQHLYKLLKNNQPDMLQTWLYHSDLIGLIMGRLLNTPRVLWNVRCSHMNFKAYARTTYFTFIILSWLSRFPDMIIANSKAGKKSHQQKGYHRKNWKIIPNGFDTDRFRPNPEVRTQTKASIGVEASSKVIGMVARYDPMKDYNTFFSAARQISSDYPDTCFVLAGRGMDKKNSGLQQIITKNKLGNRTYLLGERNDIDIVFQSFDVNTLSSLGEGFPNVLGEAMSCGIPCIATDVGDAADIIGDTGKVVQPGKPDSLAKAWTELLSMEPKKRKELGLKARKRIEDRYSIIKIVQKYEDLYFDLLSRGKTTISTSGFVD